MQSLLEGQKKRKHYWMTVGLIKLIEDVAEQEKMKESDVVRDILATHLKRRRGPKRKVKAS